MWLHLFCKIWGLTFFDKRNAQMIRKFWFQNLFSGRRLWAVWIAFVIVRGVFNCLLLFFFSIHYISSLLSVIHLHFCCERSRTTTSGFCKTTRICYHRFKHRSNVAPANRSDGAVWKWERCNNDKPAVSSNHIVLWSAPAVFCIVITRF